MKAHIRDTIAAMLHQGTSTNRHLLSVAGMLYVYLKRKLYRSMSRSMDSIANGLALVSGE